MGCKSSKTKETKPASTAANAKSNAANTSPQLQQQQPADKKNDVATPAGRVNNGEITEGASRAGPPRKAAGPGGAAAADARTGTSAPTPQQELDEDGNPVVLPKGDWVRTEGTPYYYSEKENLYFHPPSSQFYDPTNEMWYDPEKEEWYRDDDDNTLP
ncbi:hypothetical protein DQ04_03941060 [Trypanosoma grayi]|uniref:hypothetical protein n=1 Tax=Trypanosoma grayi TaxID=71804 RepID=UPI0004F49682|nr:hypothetical protein DQ04_03941060 [Trypanosoma grayi]KEG10280.1 hypothetical protein DQ04_03941060 [Trypanosoma grayi]